MVRMAAVGEEFVGGTFPRDVARIKYTIPRAAQGQQQKSLPKLKLHLQTHIHTHTHGVMSW